MVTFFFHSTFPKTDKVRRKINWTPPGYSVFFSREPQKSAREHFGKSAREPFEFAREHF